MSEKIEQSLFVEKLKQSHWYVREQITDHTQHARADVIAYHPVFDENIAFEIKIPHGFNDETRALRQMIRYRNTYFDKINVAIFCYMKPQNRTYDCDWASERFFWRWGFGYGLLETMVVNFVGGTSKARINLMHPEDERFIDPKTKIRLIRETSKKYWLNDCDTDQL